MTKPRSHYVDPNHTRYYHVTSRCVRRAWLLGNDPLTGVNFDHRKSLLLNRLRLLARHFSVSIMGYAVMSNHFHLVVRYDPNEASRWPDEEVARRWCAVFHGGRFDQSTEGAEEVDHFSVAQAIRYHQLLLNPEHIDRCRRALGSLSRFMQHLKQPFAVWANHEEQCSGHFFEARFYSGVLLDRDDLLACMAYVDLNPAQAGMAKSLREANDTSIHERLYGQRFDPDQLEAYLAPLWQDDEETQPDDAQLCTLAHYAQQLNHAIVHLRYPHADLADRFDRWMARLVNRERLLRNQAAAFFDYV